MHIVDLEQNTPEWESWRNERGCLGASDAPAICGVDKYTSYRMLYEQKINGAPSNISDYIADKAHFFETRSHAMSGIVLNHQYERDVCAEHDKNRFIRASFDGINFEAERFWENKYCGAKEFEAVHDSPSTIDVWNVKKVKANIILSRYLPQLAQQAYVSGYSTCDFTVYNDQADDVANIEVRISKDFIEGVIGKVIAFRNLLLTKTPPPLTTLDSYTLESPVDIARFKALIEAFKEGDRKEEARLREEITRLMPHTRVECMGVQVLRAKGGKTIFRNLKKLAQGES
ncbi:MAG: hypothetical protein R2827_03140 [Bdellovibrionales bacterium]